MIKLPKVILLMTLATLFIGCASVSDRRSALYRESPLVGWEELTVVSTVAVTLPSHPVAASPVEPNFKKAPRVMRSYSPARETALATAPPERLSNVAPPEWEVARKPKRDLPVWTLRQTLTDLIAYQKGFLGKLGTAKVYVASRDRVPDQTRLYWVIVKVLSEKYGCFMTQQRTESEKVMAYCRDGRIIVIWRSLADDTVQFLARQYDREGYEIVVRRRKIYRVSGSPTLTVL